MKCQIPFVCFFLNKIKIINLSSAELAQRVVKVSYRDTLTHARALDKVLLSTQKNCFLSFLHENNISQ